METPRPQASGARPPGGRPPVTALGGESGPEDREPHAEEAERLIDESYATLQATFGSNDRGPQPGLDILLAEPRVIDRLRVHELPIVLKWLQSAISRLEGERTLEVSILRPMANDDGVLRPADDHPHHLDSRIERLQSLNRHVERRRRTLREERDP